MTSLNTPKPIPSTTEVLIVGGGAVGLVTALLLARQGITPLLVERHPGTAIHPRARGLNVRTMEIFRGLGLEGAVREAGAALAKNELILWVETLAGRELRRISTGDPGARAQIMAASPTGWAGCAQDELEPVLLAAAHESGADIRFHTELVALNPDDAGVTATVSSLTTGQRQTIRARYVVVADGARSPLRHALGIHSVGLGTLTHNIGIYFRADLRAEHAGRNFILCFIENQNTRGLLLSVNNTDRWVLNVPFTPSDTVSAASFTPERCVELVRGAVGRPELAVELLSVLPWDAAARVAERFQRGRVFFVGDAAHLMPPTGAFGLNTGIAGAHNLAWKLAAVLSGAARPALLETYDAERRPVAAATVDNVVEAARRRFAPAAPGRTNARADQDNGQAPPPPYVDDLAMMLAPWYDSAAIVGESEPFSLAALARRGLVLDGRPGTRAPHLWLDRNGQQVSTLDLFGRGFALVAGTDAPCEELEKIARSRSIVLDLIRLPDSQAAAAYGIELSGAALVRPDGIVAWRAPTLPTAAASAIAAALDQILARPAQGASVESAL